MIIGMAIYSSTLCESQERARTCHHVVLWHELTSIIRVKKSLPMHSFVNIILGHLGDHFIRLFKTNLI